MNDCIFCLKAGFSFVAESEHLFAVRDRFPVTDLHTLIIPKAHRKDFFELNQNELRELWKMIAQLRLELNSEDASISGFNIGMNCGVSAGQTIFHCHIHVIPRRNNDCADPRGGVRGVIANKQHYEIGNI